MSPAKSARSRRKTAARSKKTATRPKKTTARSKKAAPRSKKAAPRSKKTTARSKKAAPRAAKKTAARSKKTAARSKKTAARSPRKVARKTTTKKAAAKGRRPAAKKPAQVSPDSHVRLSPDSHVRVTAPSPATATPESHVRIIQIIKKIYDAFKRGDAAAIIAECADTVEWGADTTSDVAPWYGVRNGKSEVQAFFNDFGQTMEVLEFTPLSFAANETEGLTVVRFRARVRATGKEVSMNLHHYFRFSGGKIVYYRGSEDTAQTVAALSP